MKPTTAAAPMTEDEWVRAAMATRPPASAAKKMRLALIFREREPKNDPNQR